MKGNSGAFLDFQGDYVLKRCPQASSQARWFQEASRIGLVEGIRLPEVDLVDETCYRIEYIPGFPATMLTSVSEFKKLVNLVDKWSQKPATSDATWDSYLKRLESHVTTANSPLMHEAFDIVSREEFPPSFCHGDLTLENVLVTGNGEMVLIDPNYAQDLFQSWILDLGKLLQSTHSDYHRVFNSSPGVDPKAHLNYLKSYLQARVLWKKALVSELSHIIRLRRYRPPTEFEKVDEILSGLIAEIKNLKELA